MPLLSHQKWVEVADDEGEEEVDEEKQIEDHDQEVWNEILPATIGDLVDDDSLNPLPNKVCYFILLLFYISF